ncbi:hypothetical protein GCM10027266_00960 [Arenimonas alkanexedens]
MRIALAALLSSLSGISYATPHPSADAPYEEIVFASAGQLLAWCETETRAHYAGQGLPTYQWTGRHWRNGNTLHAEGKIRVNGKDIPATCVVAQGARERYAAIRIAPPD